MHLSGSRRFLATLAAAALVAATPALGHASALARSANAPQYAYNLYRDLFNQDFPDAEAPAGMGTAVVADQPLTAALQRYGAIGAVTVNFAGPDAIDQVSYYVFGRSDDALRYLYDVAIGTTQMVLQTAQRVEKRPQRGSWRLLSSASEMV